MFDIETAGQYPTWRDFVAEDQKGSELFQKKYERMKWEDRYGDIDTAYLENSPIISAYGRICCISFGFLHEGQKRIKSFAGVNEKEILLDFKRMLEKIEKKNFSLSGYRIWHFDIPWILHKMHKYSIKPPSIISVYDKKPWETRIVDLAEDWKLKFAWTSSFDEVCYELGIESPKDKIDGSDVHKRFHNGDIDDIIEYCEKDVAASLEMDIKIYQNGNAQTISV